MHAGERFRDQRFLPLPCQYVISLMYFIINKQENFEQKNLLYIALAPGNV